MFPRHHRLPRHKHDISGSCKWGSNWERSTQLLLMGAMLKRGMNATLIPVPDPEYRNGCVLKTVPHGVQDL